MNFKIDVQNARIEGITKAILSKVPLEKQAGVARNFLKSSPNMVRRGPRKPSAPKTQQPSMGPIKQTPPQPGNKFTRTFWDYNNKKAKPALTALSHAGGLGALGAGGYGASVGSYNLGNANGQIAGARKTIDTATNTIDNMGTSEQILFLLSLIGDERPEIVAKLKELIPEGSMA